MDPVWSRVAAAAVGAVLVTGCTVPGPGATAPAAPEATQTQTQTQSQSQSQGRSGSASRAPSSAGPAEPGSALAAFATLEVKGRAPLTGYDRDAFGQAWLDADRNGCDTRNDVLGEQLTDPVFKVGTRECKVLRGLLADPYTGTDIVFDDSSGDGSGIDVDHVVALGNAWVSGAAGRGVPELAAIANDPLNLLAVDAGANRSKGDGDAATWLPPQRVTWCPYVARQVAVKVKYALWVTPAEAATVRRVLDSCPDEPLPPDSGAATEVSFLADDGERSSCADLAARGLTPVRRGDADYDPALDGDDDGVACE